MPFDELVAQYDSAGAVVGSVARSVVRASGLWHAATLVLVRSSAGLIYVHRRSPAKDVFPGLLDCFAGGVVAAGETPFECAVREVGEELGVTGVTPIRLFGFRYVAPPIRYHAFVYSVVWDGPVVWQASEVVSGSWVSVDALVGLLADPAVGFVPDGREAFRLWLAM